jgi:uncharacterized protein
MRLSRYLRVYPTENYDRFLLFSTLRASSVLVSGATLRAAQNGSLGEAEGKTLKRLGMLVEDPAKEREQMRSLIERINNESRVFKAMVVLNLDCNLDCGYCYEGEFRGNRYMSEETARLLVDMLIRDRISAGIDLSLTFYGGEPLLSEDLIRSISLPLLEAAKLHKVRYSFGLVTNGTLLDRQTAQRLIALGLTGAKFTLDGPREIHDRQRPYASGSGSFDTIVENLGNIWDIVPIQLGGNFYQENYREFPHLLDHLIECGITPEKIKQVLFSPVTPKAGCSENGAGCSCSNEPWLIEALPFLREEIQSRGFATSKIKPSACIVELTDNIVVNVDGTLYKCPAFMGWDGYSIGTLAEGVSDYSESHCIGNWQTEECLDCSYLPLCFGGCRFLNLLQDKGIGEVDCKRDFLDATLESMILQNMKHAAARAAKAPAGKP